MFETRKKDEHTQTPVNPHHELLDFLLAKPKFLERNKSCTIRLLVWLFVVVVVAATVAVQIGFDY